MSFRDEFFGRFPEPKQCNTRSTAGRCPDKAFYVTTVGDGEPKFYCTRCVSAVLFFGTNTGKTVTVGRIEGARVQT